MRQSSSVSSSGWSILESHKAPRILPGTGLSHASAPAGIWYTFLLTTFYQYDKITGELVRIWNSVHDILVENPNWKRHNIYAACSGEKPSIYGYKWKKIKNEDIVQP